MLFEPVVSPPMAAPDGERRGEPPAGRGRPSALDRALETVSPARRDARSSRSPSATLPARAARTWLLPHGSAQCYVAACMAVRAARGRQVVVQRDAGPGVMSGLIASGLAPYWLAPELDPIAGVAHGVTAAALDAALTEAPGARAAIVVSPTFHGATPDVAELAAVAHCHGAALVVDEARGAHLPGLGEGPSRRFARRPPLPAHAIAAGADLVVTGPAMLHQGPLAERWLPAAAIERAVALCEPGAPDAPALAALGAARARAIDGERLLEAALRAAAAARAQLTGVPGVRVLGPELVGSPGVAGFDPLRLTVDLHDSRRDARGVAEALRERGIEPELATDRLLVCGLGTGDGELGLAERFATALLDALWAIPPVDEPAFSLPPARPGPAICTPRAAWLAPQERVPAEAAAGRVAAETLTPFPPGVPAVLPGERLEADVVATLRALVAAGGVVRGSVDGLGTFAVVAGSQGGASRRPPGTRRARAANGRWTRT
jgi:lysine decarboxylase